MVIIIFGLVTLLILITVYFIINFKKLKVMKKKELSIKLLENAPIGICFFDRTGTLQDVNKYFEDYLSYVPIIDFADDKFAKNNYCYEKELQIDNQETVRLLMNKAKVKNKKNDFIGTILMAIDITGQKKISTNNYFDNLTNLYNRNYIEQELKRLDTERQLPLGIIMGDVNGLKMINDTFGHKKGDQLLKKVAELIKISCRSEDIISRWGGDEFLILLPKTTKKQLKKIVKRIKKQDKTFSEDKLPLSIAVGYEVKKNKDQTMEGVIKKAEDLMYQNKVNESRSLRNDILSTLLVALEKSSLETEAHAFRMQASAFKFGEALNLSESELDRLSILVTLHDVGKVAISEKILCKKERLTIDEWEEVQKHSEIGYRIANSSREFAYIAEDILCHHEHWDGSGYPQKLKGGNIPFLARITSILDAYDVMVNGRPYKKAMTKQEALAEIERCKGSQFDPELAQIFIEYYQEKEIYADI
jgi:diguanylate cyclase (GGDEF)-like protein